MMQQLNLRQKLMIAAIPLLLLGAMWLVALSSSRLKVTSSDPSPNQKINVYNVVFVHYSQNINAAHAKITANPDFSFSTKTSGNTLTITPAHQLENSTIYTISVKGVCSQKDPRSCTDYGFKFSTDNTISLSNLSEEQQKQVVSSVDSQFHQTPILSILPVSQPDFIIDARPVGNAYTYIIITPSLDPGSLTPQEYDSTYKQYYQEGKDYLTQKGYPLEAPNYKVMSDQEFSAMTASGGD